MQRRKKQLLGLVGLALVAAITAIACAIPTPGASAADDDVVFRSAIGLKVVVDQNVPANAPWAELTSPASGEDVGQKFTAAFEYKNSNGADLELIQVNEDGEDTVTKLSVASCGMTLSEASQTCDIEVDLGPFPFGEDGVTNTGVTYRLRLVPRNGNAYGVEDAVEVYYRAAMIKYNGKNESGTSNPIVDVYINDAADYALVEVYDQDGNAVFVDDDGEQEPLKITSEQIQEAANGHFELTLPMSQAGAKAGIYRVVLVAYGKTDEGESKVLAIASDDKVLYKVDANGRPIGSGTTNKPNGSDDPSNSDDDSNSSNSPDVPDTGSIFRDLNISRADYLIVGLLAFGLVTIFAVVLIVRRNKR